MIVALNVSEEDLNDSTLVEGLQNDLKAMSLDVMQVSAKVESEIANLGSDEDKKEFIQEHNWYKNRNKTNQCSLKKSAQKRFR